MLRVPCIGTVIMVMSLASVAAASDPAVSGSLQGLELAQQTQLHPAVFVGVFTGRVDGQPALGAWAAGVQHETPLPDADDESILITGGQWKMEILVLQGFRLRRVALSGVIAGELEFLDTDLFTIAAGMTVVGGGSGLILLNAILDHTVFPPGVSGALSQP